MGNERFIREELKRLEQRAKKVVEETKALVLSLNLNGTVTKEQGPIAPTLLKRALKRDGLVMGSRGLDALDRFMLGSVPTRVTLHASCSILVVKEQPRPLRRILPSTDGSKPSEKAFQFTLTKPRADGRGSDGGFPLEGTIIHVMPFLKYPELKDAGGKLVRQCGSAAQGGVCGG